MKISVIIPAYNAAGFLPRCLASVFAQTLAPDEVIVVDDGSTDNTAQVAEQLGARVLRKPNGGSAAARNTGIQSASGEWIALLDADDSWLPEKLARQASLIRPDTVLVYTGIRLVDNCGVRSIRSAVDPVVANKTLRYRNPITPSSVLLLREAALANGGFRESAKTCEDWDMWARLKPLGQFAAVEEALTDYYIHPENISASAEKMLDGFRTILEATLLAPYRGIERWVWRRRIWAVQLFSAAMIARNYKHQGEFRYGIRSVLSWPSPFWEPQRFTSVAVSARNVLQSWWSGAEPNVLERAASVQMSPPEPLQRTESGKL